MSQEGRHVLRGAKHLYQEGRVDNVSESCYIVPVLINITDTNVEVLSYKIC
jgi:hypothetical protein